MTPESALNVTGWILKEPSDRIKFPAAQKSRVTVFQLGQFETKNEFIPRTDCILGSVKTNILTHP
jgi:hypothetical protein